MDQAGNDRTAISGSKGTRVVLSLPVLILSLLTALPAGSQTFTMPTMHDIVTHMETQAAAMSGAGARQYQGIIADLRDKLKKADCRVKFRGQPRHPGRAGHTTADEPNSGTGQTKDKFTKGWGKRQKIILNPVFFVDVGEAYCRRCPTMTLADKQCLVKDFAGVSLVHEWLHTQQAGLFPRDQKVMECEAWKAEKDIACVLGDEIPKYQANQNVVCSVGWAWNNIKTAITMAWAKWCRL